MLLHFAKKCTSLYVTLSHLRSKKKRASITGHDLNVVRIRKRTSTRTDSNSLESILHHSTVVLAAYKS